MKTKLLTLTCLLINIYTNAQEAFKEHLINQPLSNPAKVQSADIDNDTDKDFAVISVNGELTWHEQIATNTFSTHYIARDIQGGQSLAVADLDGDTNMDIIATHSENGVGTISWFQNDGNQNFTKTVLSNTDISPNSNKTIVIDIDNDNDLDVITSVAGEVRILKNDGSENFTNESTSISLGNSDLNENSSDIEIIDFDNDNLLDFVVTTRNNGLNWYKQNSNNTFTINSVATGNFVNVTVGNLDNDTDLDIIVTSDSNTSGTGDDIIVFNNSGDNINFTQTALQQVESIKGINLFDVDNDNDLDLVFFSSGVIDKGLIVRLNENDYFSNNVKHTVYLSDYFNDVNGSSNYVDFILEDINLDNNIDIIQVNGNIGRINYYRNNDVTLALNNFTLFEVSNSSGDADVISVGDLNNDNSLDVVVSSLDEYTLEWFKNSGNNIDFSSNRIDYLPKEQYSKNALVDIDEDGFLDVLSVNAIPNTGGFYWYKNNGDETFTVNGLQTINNGGESPVNIYSADFDNDGDIDILNVSNLKIYLLTNDGNESFTTTELFSRSLCCFNTVEIYDINNDNLPEIVFLGNSNTMGYLLNNGGNTFSSFNSFFDISNNPLIINNVVYDFEFTDIDNDNDMDIVLASDNLILLENNGSDRYELDILIALGNFAQGRVLKVEDIDMDNDKDIIVGGTFGPYWAKNENGSFTRELLVPNDNYTSSNVFDLKIVDMDNDGDSDVIYTSYTGNKVAWLENKINEVLSSESYENTNQNVSIYPNPTSSSIKIKSTNGINQVILFDALGKIILKEETTEIDVSSLQKGMYFLKILTNENNIVTKKVLKQ